MEFECVKREDYEKKAYHRRAPPDIKHLTHHQPMVPDILLPSSPQPKVPSRKLHR